MMNSKILNFNFQYFSNSVKQVQVWLSFIIAVICCDDITASDFFSESGLRAPLGF
jgi:hypothetical protein